MPVTGRTPTLRLRRESTAEQVASALRELIVTARLGPGSHLREGPLAEQLRVSRNTLREAVQILVSQGLVRREMHRGAYVATLTAEDVRDIFRVRRLVEVTALRNVQRDDDKGSLRDAVQALGLAVQSGVQTEIALADLRCHQELVQLMDSARLGELYESIAAELQVCVAIAAPAGPRHASVLEDHRAILRALERGDTERAVSRLARHLDVSERQLSEHVEARKTSAGDPSADS